MDALLLVAQVQHQARDQASQGPPRNSSSGALSSPPSSSALDPSSYYTSAGRGIASYMTSRFAGLMAGASGAWQPLPHSHASPSHPSTYASSGGLSSSSLTGRQAGGSAGSASAGLRSSVVGPSSQSSGAGAGDGHMGAGSGRSGGGGSRMQEGGTLHPDGTHSAAQQTQLAGDQGEAGVGAAQHRGSTGRGAEGVCTMEVGEATAALRAQQAAILASVEAAHGYEAQLRVAARALFSQAPEALGQKW